MIVADTGAIIALVDQDDTHHAVLATVYRETGHDWVLPWAILPEVDYLLAAHVGSDAQDAFLADLSEGLWTVVWGDERDLRRAYQIHQRYRDLALGLVDCSVIAAAERLAVDAIVTIDTRDFGAVQIEGAPLLYPRDLP